MYAYDFAENRVPGVQDYEERAYWRDVGTLSALAAAQQDAMGTRPRFNLWNSRWPIRGEYDAAMLERMRAFREWAMRPGPLWTYIKMLFSDTRTFKRAVRVGLEHLRWATASAAT